MMRESGDVRYAAPLFNLRAVMIGTVTALVASMAIVAVTALLMYFTPLSEQYLSIGLYYVGFGVVIFSGLVASRAARRLGWLHGGLAGMTAATLAMLLLALLFPGGLSTAEVFRQAALAFGAGAVGGVIGVNA